MTVELTIRERHCLLAQLANFLDDLPHSKFHMPTWGSKDWTETSCGTAGCAAGWAVTLFHKFGPRMRKSGLKSDPYPLFCFGNICGPIAFSNFFEIDQIYAVHITANLDGFSNIIRYKSLPSYCEEYNLMSIEDITPQMAASRIRKVLQEIDPESLQEKTIPQIRQEKVCLTI